MFSDLRAQHSDTHAGGTSMRLLKYVPQIACAVLLLGTLAATPALGQATTVNMAVSLSGGGIIDFGSTGFFQIRTTVPAGAGDARNVVLNGVFTPGCSPPCISSSPTASLSGFGSGTNGRGCVSPNPGTPTNPNSFRCTIGQIINGTQVSNPGAPGFDPNLQRRIVISQPAPQNLPTTCPPTEHAGDLQVTMTAQNAPTVVVNRVGHDTEDFTDLSVALSGPDRANVGDTVAFNVTVTNFGPCAADNICASNPGGLLGAHAFGLVFQSNTGDCTKLYGDCNTAAPTLPDGGGYQPQNECGFAQGLPDGGFVGGSLAPGASYRIRSTYTVAPLARSITSVGDTNEVDIVSDTNIVNYGSHTQAATTDTIVQNDTSCSVSSTGSMSIALVALVVLVAYALNRRRRS